MVGINIMVNGRTMKLRYIVLLILTSASLMATNNAPLWPHKNDDVMIDAIKKGNGDKIREMLIPGFFTDKESMRRYLDAARAATNETYKDLHSYRAWDFVRGTKAMGQLALGGLGIAACYYYYKGHWDISHWKVEAGKSRKIGGQDLRDKKYRLAVYGVLGFLSGYMINDGLTEFSDILHKKEQWRRHRETLANEGVIMRMPICNVDTCDMLAELQQKV